MLKIGVIGYGGRSSSMVKSFGMFDIPFKVTAIADPRSEEIKKNDDGFLKDCAFYKDADELIAQADVDGIMIGTRCFMHAEMACKAAKRNIPLFLEKPIAISFAQYKMIDEAFKNFSSEVVVSFPLRLSPIVETVREIINSGKIGTVEHVAAFNDVPYGDCYYNAWYRNYNEVGGLFLQKATHDYDYINYILGQKPKTICAMKGQKIYGGDKPFDLKCKDCGEQSVCPESPFNLFYKRFLGDKICQSDWRMCMFSEGIKNEDFGNSIVEYENGTIFNYTQNFFVRNHAGRRGCRLYGYKGTIYFDWYLNQIKLYKHDIPVVETIDFVGNMPHFGGDRELVYDFLMAMKEGKPSRSPLSAGMTSVLMCLWARESAETKKFCEIVMP